MGCPFHRAEFSVLMVIVVLRGFTKMSEARDSCPITKLTVEVVEKCPDNEEKWAEAAARKNCQKYASQCDEPERLVYHCVINPYVNQTLEVCAYAQNILLGHCAEYNCLGNLIQSNTNANCQSFTKDPCPIMYRSTDSYKYPMCYELTKMSNKITKRTESTLNEIYETSPSSNVSPVLPDTRESGNRGHGNGGNILSTALLLTVVTLVVD